MSKTFEDVEANPLHWPVTWPRCEYPTTARFKTSFTSARDGLINELMLLGAEDFILSSNLTLRLDGLPLAKQRAPDDHGVAVYFVYEDERQCIPCDKWNQVVDNIQAIRLTVEALRGLERWGAKQMVKAAFAGFKMIPEQTGRFWPAVLGCDINAGLSEAVRCFKQLARVHHPDQGGDPIKFNDVATAMKQAREYYE